jgi:hypothetical protein
LNHTNIDDWQYPPLSGKSPKSPPHASGLRRRDSPVSHIGKSPGKSFRLLVVEKESDQFYACGDANPVENFEKVVPNDQMLARGYSPRAVAVTFYCLTAVLVSAAWFSLQLELMGRMLTLTLSVVGVLICAIWLGALTEENREIRPDSPKKLAACEKTELPF